MPNDKQEQALFSVEELPKPRKSSKSSKPVAEIAPNVEEKASKNQSLATRMRPRNLDEFAGQAHILGPGKVLRCAIEADRIQSLILYGPPGIGKTSLGQIIANQTKTVFEELVGGEADLEKIRNVLLSAKHRLADTGACTTLFIDEVHRLIPSQLAPLLHAVENGVIKLIGATTENLAVSGKGPLVSRSQICELKPLAKDDLLSLLRRAVKDEERGLGKLKIVAEEDALRHLVEASDGDARKALNSLEIAATTPPVEGVIRITLDVAEQSIQRKAIGYSKDVRFDTLSAYQKAIRGSDPDAALYWLAKMIAAGEDPHVIARRLCVSASEDVGMANSMAMLVAFAAWEAVDRIGPKEARIHLAHATVYLATSPKSFSSPVAIDAALADLENNPTHSMPEHLRDKHSPGIRGNFLYKHPKDYPGNFVAQDYLGADTIFYHPSDQGAEKAIQPIVENWRRQFQEVRRAGKPAAPKKNLPPGTCSTCHHGQPFNGSFMCVNETELAKNPNPGKPLIVKPDNRCDSFEPATAR
jgi:putative ATPase